MLKFRWWDSFLTRIKNNNILGESFDNVLNVISKNGELDNLSILVYRIQRWVSKEEPTMFNDRTIVNYHTLTE